MREINIRNVLTQQAMHNVLYDAQAKSQHLCQRRIRKNLIWRH